MAAAADEAPASEEFEADVQPAANAATATIVMAAAGARRAAAGLIDPV
jgi:hypothetical protein